jgi:COMM domain containing 9
LQQIISSQISLPRLESINWRVDVKSASDLMNQMSVPTVLVQMQVCLLPPTMLANCPATHQQQHRTDRWQIRDEDLEEDKQVSRVQFELSKEGLQTVLEGLGKIRDQLSSTAAAQ